MNEIVKMKFGSHLYGTDTPKSDVDYKGVFIPNAEMVLLGKIPKSLTNNTGNHNDKNSPDDVDDEMYSLHYFIELACKGETVALDMLHAPLTFVDHYTEEWRFIHDHRRKFYTKNLKAFVGYARRQAAKYGIKGSRLSAAKEVLDAINRECFRWEAGWDLSLCDIWDKLPQGEYRKFIEDSPNGLRQYEVCGRILQETQNCRYAHQQLGIFYRRYGERAKLAAKNEGIDFKAISHALRAAYQVKELLKDNTITFPRPEAEFLREVKLGKLHYKNEIEPILDTLIAEVDKLSLKSTLPDKVDRKFWDDFIMVNVQESIRNESL